jgi:hypothetical protein
MRKARVVWIVEGKEIDEPDGWHVVAVVKSWTDRDGLYHVLVVQEREL